MRKVVGNIFKIVIIVSCLSAFFYLIFRFLIINRVQVTSDPINTYQFYQLIIIYTSSCVTTLALVVALLKDEIRALWLKAKIVIKPKFPGFIIEKQIDTLGTPTDVRAEYYYVALNVSNVGALHINLCSISLMGLQYKAIHRDAVDVDISLVEEIKWSKSTISTPIHPNGGKAEATIITIKINDAGTTGESQSQSAQLFVGSIDATKGHHASAGSLWIATFMIYYDKSKPVEYKLEISWDGEWHNRLSEMREHIRIKEL